MTDDTSQTIGTIQKNQRSDVVVSIGTYHGHKLTDVRIHMDGKDGERRPTKQGVSLGILHIDKLIELLQRARDEARARGWI